MCGNFHVFTKNHALNVILKVDNWYKMYEDP